MYRKERSGDVTFWLLSLWLFTSTLMAQTGTQSTVRDSTDRRYGTWAGDHTISFPSDNGPRILSTESKDKLSKGTIGLNSLLADKKAKKAWEKGEQAFRRKQFDQARREFQAAVDRCPLFALAWFSIGQCYVELGRLEEARKALSRASEVDKDFPQTYIEMARIALIEKKWPEVVDWIDIALTLDPRNFPESYIMLATAHLNLNHPEMAEIYAQKAKGLGKPGQNPQLYLILAGIRQAQGDFAGERECLRSYLRCIPRGDNAEIVRGRLLELEKLLKREFVATP